MNDDTNEPAIEPLLVLSARIREIRSVSGTPLGDRAIYDVEGGTFEGPNLSGRVLATGGDWVTRTRAGAQMSVRLLLETHDGVTVLFQYSGRASQSDGKRRLEAAGTFEA